MVNRALKLIIIIAVLLISSDAFAAALKIGDKAPGFSLTSMIGEKVSLSDAKGSKVVILGLFHICEPCMNQAMELQKVYEKNKDNVAVIGVNASGDSRRDVQEYLNSFPIKVNFPYLLDPEHTTEKLFSVRATPVVYIIDKEGVIRFKGSSRPAQELQRVVDGILNEKS
jgi:cytochrome c biogenesis protein CcmG/thiol:disulfide interchange protein DsbE